MNIPRGSDAWMREEKNKKKNNKKEGKERSVPIIFFFPFIIFIFITYTHTHTHTHTHKRKSTKKKTFGTSKATGNDWGKRHKISRQHGNGIAAEMLKELHGCPSLFVTTTDRCSIMAKMNEEAERFCVSVVMPSGLCYQDEFDEKGLCRVKETLGGHVSWARFFSVVREAFNNGQVTVQKATDASVEVMCHSDASGEGDGVWGAEFNVSKVDVSVLPTIVKGLVDLYQFQAHPNTQEQKLKRLTEEVAQLKVKAEQLEKEVCFLKEIAHRRRKLDMYNIQRIKQLREEVANYEGNYDCTHGATKGEATTKKGHRSSTQAPKKGRIRQPLGEEECVAYDPELLRLIKSRWMTLSDVDASSSYNSVIVPSPSPGISNQTPVFGNKQQEVVWEALNKLDEWDYNVFEVQQAMSGDDFASLHHQQNGGSLFITMYALLIKYSFLSKFNIDEQIALNWISCVEAGYNGNPYHNSMHAADVVYITHYILSKGGMIERCQLSDLQVFAALFAAAIHDYNHPGVNNNFHIKAQSYSAILYNDRSVLENAHVSSVFELMKNPRFNILESFSEDQQKKIRETVIEMVLATDMSLHGKHIAHFNDRLEEHVSFTERENQNLALVMALKMADISNCGRPLEIYLKWSSKLSDEFYLQGDRERNLGMQCSPFMDRMEPALAKGQILFISYIVIPFFERMAVFLPKMRVAVEYAESCKAYWLKAGQG
ncbi:cAMP phosphodiesterase A, putative [Trypanosoma cruzi marinkellei]|uniref:Phosphodiesterase n=1 Tax=Trypanosoma cruzi marinkellei TaxID=85056 RepID=K2M852_TRYCR|nr:cAMP phosphodiesterase A, putative [Trypanosoma cruzi marinkellei]